MMNTVILGWLVIFDQPVRQCDVLVMKFIHHKVLNLGKNILGQTVTFNMCFGSWEVAEC